MSIRPSSRIRSTANAVLPANISYVIIGDTSLATVYATKLYETFRDSGSFPQIYLLTSGNDQTTDVSVENLDYIAQNNQSIYKALKSQLVHLVLDSNEPINTLLAPGNNIFESYYNFYSGAGPNGDSITAYYQMLVGPWFNTDSRGRLENFVKASTIQKDLTPNEFNVMNNIASLFNLAKTTSVVATKPSILTLNNIFVYNQGSKLERQIYYPLLNELKHGPQHQNVNIATHVTNIRITPTDSCLSTVGYSTITGTNPDINNACVLWMNNLYSFVQIAGMNNLVHKKVVVPVFYRSVMSMPEITPYVNLSNLDPNVYPLNMGDNLSTRLTFTCTDVAQPGESLNLNVPTWLVTAYTTTEDFANPGSGGTYSSLGNTLLVVEATSLTNRRTFSWDAINMAVTVHLNSNNVELGSYNKFLLLAANVYQAFTGSPPPLPIGVTTICTPEGVCTDAFPLQHTTERESPQTTVLRLMSSLYGSTYFPTPNAVNGQSCCG